jgi:hypothetical protein
MLPAMYSATASAATDMKRMAVRLDDVYGAVTGTKELTDRELAGLCHLSPLLCSFALRPTTFTPAIV